MTTTRMTYAIGDLFVRDGELAMLVQIAAHEFKLICLKSGNRITDRVLKGASHYKLAPSRFQRTFGTTWKPVAPMSQLELAIYVSREGRQR